MKVTVSAAKPLWTASLDDNSVIVIRGVNFSVIAVGNYIADIFCVELVDVTAVFEGDDFL